MNFYKDEPAFREWLKHNMDPELFEFADIKLNEFGEQCGTVIDERAIHTDREGQPQLIRYNRFGEEVSNVWVNEGYEKTAAYAYGEGMVSYVHEPMPGLGASGGYLYSLAQGYLLSQTEAGFYCPVTLSMATAHLLVNYGDETLKHRFLPHVLSTGEHEIYEGATFLTERQGGSDVGANDTKAVKAGDHYQLYGEKYFASNAGRCGIAMVLARMEESPTGTKGLSLFAVPWRNEDGSVNGLRIRRLKDKLGVRAVPSGEVEFEGAKAYLVGDADRGFSYMMEALNLSRVCTAVGGVGIMRRAYTEARDYARQREAFGKELVQYPMIQEILGGMAVKQEMGRNAVFQLAQLFENTANKQQDGDEEVMMMRLLTALLKNEASEQSVQFAKTAIETLGGNGYIEDFVTPRLLRDAQVLTVWEGTENILALELLRLVKKHHVQELLLQEVKGALTQLSDHQRSEIKPLIDNGLQLMQRLLTRMKQPMEEGEETLAVRKLLRVMTHLYESTIAISMLENGNARDEAVGNAYLIYTWKGESDLDRAKVLASYFREYEK
ncbi:alkylation response protein AidB-like acyl-CoA dehydrogenase [Geomicrobium halophilum]|uniref:Alkylation response protein AidB-like acyl-CoA dehydrogenase n=1 Tax=Geomicrobium halophilum TaxID=549000 RepID=A0A841Q0U7_9BACL|nr:acyl-CoA dehydrogenase family protein [Geomicrobium halophilum]MBB6451342.1 alkylation response protein AidB-like acyl-CoA dehydrogenase [Geomicrobium halophilum]